MGALSPRTRNAQVELYQSGDVDFLVATDAIGMGLNLDVDHVAFADASRRKFDGRQHLRGHRRYLRADELRARSPAAPAATLDAPPARKGLTRVPTATDQVALEFVARDIDTLSNRIRHIRTWTFVANRRNWLTDPTHWREKTRDIEDRLSDVLHEKLTQRFVDRRTSVLVRHLKDRRMTSPIINDRGEISLEGHHIGTIEGFRFTLARTDGDLDAKALRSAAEQVVAPEIVNRAERLAGAPNEEFVLATDGRLRWRGEVVAELVEGDALLRPRVLVLADEALTGVDLERVQDRLTLWLRHHVNTVLDQVVALEAPTDLEGPARGIAFQLYEHLGLLPRQQVADQVKGLDQEVRGRLRKLGVKFGAYHIFLPMMLKPAPRELALILFALKNGGIRQPGVTDLPHVVLSGRTSVTRDEEIAPRLYEVAGFKVAGKRAVRVDILERLADIIRPLVALDASRPYEGTLPNGAAEGNGFRVTVEMTSLLGCSGEDFASILSALGYRVRRTPKPVDVPTEPAATEATAEAPAEIPAPEPASETETQTAEEPPASTEPAETLEPAVAEASEAPTEAAEPQEPQFDEVWFPGRRNDGPRREHGGRRHARNGAEAGDDAAAKSGRPDRRHSGDGRPKPKFNNRRPDGEGAEQRGDGGHRKDRPRPERRTDKPVRERREPAFDPDSPFAALMALKTKKD
jgi:ATP-dependent RNA helicase SUPV3L1/SUV3